MSENKKACSAVSMPIQGMLLVGSLGGLVTAAGLEVVKYWPLPVSVDPYFGPGTGFVWGVVVGGITGLVIGYLTDERHFN
jgi:hypothetical protein